MNIIITRDYLLHSSHRKLLEWDDNLTDNKIKLLTSN